ncbi:hypothetical protein BURCENBC7_AP0419 [Burkholderia cenocepacia BC7]|nr:hypothetical protein BURCENK562V_C3703 [Burkholderia cenocepacia K56-2Valvano]ERI29081.1 hypothetical protein BURCENBC7_AP0419 [Burkholderia cenocepacia BC7]
MLRQRDRNARTGRAATHDPHAMCRDAQCGPDRDRKAIVTM